MQAAERFFEGEFANVMDEDDGSSVVVAGSSQRRDGDAHTRARMIVSAHWHICRFRIHGAVVQDAPRG